ncbi:FAD/NAD(P)-binding domain-containing protein [Lizonia empirigonia]|nr:FAD/NAD(P)-binding domain-containing protein [Lizonia empirigonia]
MAPSLRSLVSFATILPFVIAVPAGTSDTASSKEGRTFDYVIVGGGLTGLVVAHRLSEDTSRSVLVLETGTITEDINTIIPTLGNNINHALQYSIDSAPDPGLGGSVLGSWLAKSLGLTGKDFNITYNASFYGIDGPIQASFPNFEFPDVKVMWDAFRAENYPHLKSTLRVTPNRTNLELLTGVEANRVLFENLTAKGVQFTNLASKTVSKVYARREVILAAGSVFTPKILQLSGIGPAEVLEAAGVKVKKDLAAVGANLQDHPNANMFWSTQNLSIPNPGFASDPAQNASAWTQYYTDRTGPVCQSHGSSLAFLSLQSITSNYIQIVSSIRAQKSTEYLPAIYRKNPHLLRGYEAAKSITTELLAGTKAAAVEIPMNAFGLAIAAVQRPLSFNTFQNPADRIMMTEAVRWTRRHWQSPILARFSPAEVIPGVTAQSDDEIIDALLEQRALTATFAHQSGTFYGTKKLSIVDASMIPLIPATHLQATMYAVAEKAADLIKMRNNR